MRNPLGSPLRAKAGALAPSAPAVHPARAGADRRAGPVAYGERDGADATLTLLAESRRTPVAPRDTARPPNDVLNGTVSASGDVPARRILAYANTLGYDSDVFHLGRALLQGGDQPGHRFVAHADAAWAGPLHAAVDSR
jgi:hypothetical protein